MKIKASVIGAKLKIENATIAYGSENSVSICFGFSADWSTYTQKRAYFRYGQSQTYYVDIDENGNVEIPSIVIAPPRFSVFVEGKTEDGAKTIRTDVAIINVVGNLCAEAVPVDGTSARILPLKKITQNGTYNTVDDMVDGYGKVEVDVNVKSYPFTVTGLGTFYPKDGYLFDSVTMTDLPLFNAFTSIGYDGIPKVFNEWIEYSKELADKWDPSNTKISFYHDLKLVFAPKVDTSNVTDMNYTFYECEKLVSVPLLNTSKVTYMNRMFDYCNNLTSVPEFDTSNVTDMSDMFGNCSNLTTVPLFNTSKVTYMNDMFEKCSNLITVPLFDTSNVTNMSSMFDNCNKLTSVPLFNTSKVTNMSYMFYNCNKLTSVPLFDTSNVTDMQLMFYYCQNLTSIPAFNTSKVTNMLEMFYDCQNLTSVPAFNTSNVANMVYTFHDCTSLTSILMTGTKCSFDIRSTKLGHDALVTLLNNLGTADSDATLTMGSSKLNLLSDAEKKIATDKGWTLA